MNPQTVFRARHAMGRKVRGTALVANDGFSARYDLDSNASNLCRPGHKLVGQSSVERILVPETAKVGVASARMLHELRARGLAPLAIVFDLVNPFLVQRAALGDIPMLAGFDGEIPAAIPNASKL